MFNMIDHQIAIVDYGMGNLFNVQCACARVGLRSIVTADKDIIRSSDALILPGVGAFGDAMNNLTQLDLVGVIKDHIGAQKPFLGICLGMQLLLSESEEFGGHKGLDIFKGQVVKFCNTDQQQQGIKVPQVGWNQIHFQRHEDLLQGINKAEYMYFVHSYYAVPEDAGVVLTTTRYEHVEYCSSFLKGSVFAMQFHPEKSGLAGLRLYENWAQYVHKNKELIKK
jgi:glutamine amidotransferase